MDVETKFAKNPLSRFVRPLEFRHLNTEDTSATTTDSMGADLNTWIKQVPFLQASDADSKRMVSGRGQQRLAKNSRRPVSVCSSLADDNDEILLRIFEKEDEIFDVVDQADLSPATEALINYEDNFLVQSANSGTIEVCGSLSVERTVDDGGPVEVDFMFDCQFRPE